MVCVLASGSRMGDPGVRAFSEGAEEHVPEASALGSRVIPPPCRAPEGRSTDLDLAFPVVEGRWDKKPGPEAGRT